MGACDDDRLLRPTPISFVQGETWVRSYYFAYTLVGQPKTNYDLTGAVVRMQVRERRDPRSRLLMDLSTTTGEIVLASGLVQGTTPPGVPEAPNGFTFTASKDATLALPEDLCEAWYDTFVDFPTMPAVTKRFLFGPAGYHDESRTVTRSE